MSTMAKREKNFNRNPASAEIARAILENYDINNVDDMQGALKDIFGPLFEAMLQGEMDSHLGYRSNDKQPKETTNRRNGYTEKSVKTSYGEVDIKSPRDRDGSFSPQLIQKRQRDASGIEDKVLAMYARGMSQRDIASTIEDIYGFEISHDQISNITDRVLDEVHEWQERSLKPFYPFVFVDCLYISMRKEYETKQCAVYVVLGYDKDGIKDILGLWINDTEGKHAWMAIFDQIKARGVQDILFISMDGVSGLEEGARAIFPGVTVQRCIVHLIRNSVKYVPSRDYKEFCAQLKKIYGASSLKAAAAEFEKFKTRWSQYPGAVDVWARNWRHIEQLFNYGSSVRKVMYTTNAIVSVNSSFRKVTKQGSFPNEDALFKLLYLRIQELYRKWNNRPVPNWSMVRNQLLMHDSFKEIIEKYDPIG